MLFSHLHSRYMFCHKPSFPDPHSLFGQLVDLDGQRLGRDNLILEVLVVPVDSVVPSIVLPLELIGHDLHIAGSRGAP